MQDYQQHIMGPGLSEPQKMECIVLAGGLGTRLKSAVPDLPKCMAPVAGKPFLQHLIDQLLAEGVTRFVFSLGYRHEDIESFLLEHYPQLNYMIALETEPLGTGGAIRLACQKAISKNVIITNGDTLFKANLKEMMSFHLSNHSACTLGLKPMINFDRYGVVATDKDNHILSFREKQYYNEGLINGGIYALDKDAFLEIPFPEKFSFEKDYLEKYVGSVTMMGIVQDAYFIDIGIPEDFARANVELDRAL